MKKQELATKAAKRNREKTDQLLDSIMYGIQDEKAKLVHNSFVEKDESD